MARMNLAKTALAIMCGLAIAASAAAQSNKFDIPEGDLKTALEVYAKQSGVRLIYLSEDVGDRRTAGARGDMSQEAALSRLLAGTDLTVERDQSGALAIVRKGAKMPAPKNPAQPSSSLGQAGIDTLAQAESDRTDTNASSSSSLKTLGAVQVTGSHIKRAQMTGVGPMTVIDAETIHSSGAVSVETLLQRLPASAGAAGSQSNNFWTGNGNGATQVNLRGLGVNRTLVLLNGRRVVSGGTGANNSVDLNIVPLALVQSIEILKDGASAVYGADAVAGVVNILTRKDMNGVELSTRFGQTFQGDGEISSFNLAFGTSSERGSMFGALTYAESGTVTMASRAPCPLGVVAGALECVGNSSTIGGRARLADGRVVNFNQDPNGDPRSFELYDPAKHNYNYNNFLNAVSPIKRVGLSGFGQFDLTKDIRVFTELMATNRQSHQRASPNTLGVYRTIQIAATNPTNPTGQNLTLQRRRLEEAGARITAQEVDTFRAVLGLEGQWGDSWAWNTAINWGRNSATDSSTNIANLDRVENTLNTALCSNMPGAAIPCGNYLGFGNLSPEVLDYILFTQRGSGGNSQLVGSGTISGSLFELPAGSVGFASGVEFRRERGWLYPDSLVVNGSANIVRQDPIEGGYSAKEAFVEFAVPLLRNVAIADYATLNVAGRFSNYDLFGSDTNYKVGLDWQVANPLKIRLNYATAFRIPSVPELFGGIGQGSLTTLDPCSNWSSPTTNAVIRANCQAAGVPTNFRQLGNTILTTTGGNPSLQPEDARTFTAGFVWTPGFAPGLTMTADYYRVRIENAIRSIQGSVKLNTCYTTPNRAHPFCSPSNFTRDPVTGEVNYLSSQQVNAASEEAEGVDIGLLYQFNLGAWQASASLDASYLERYDVTPFAGAATIKYSGKITSGLGSYTQARGLGSLRMAKDRWTGVYTAQYIGGADDISAVPGTIGSRAPGVLYQNLQLSYGIKGKWDVSAGVENLLDKKAPFIQNNPNANTDTMTYDLLGRRWNVRVGYHW
ncbi:MAG: TonB-dependent receptor [Luteimonas sp.]